MLVYHTGFDIIKYPDLLRGRRNADFGPGFYLSPDKEFSLRWAKRSSTRKTYVNEYEFNTEGLNIVTLTKDEQWFDFIKNNRNGNPDSLNDVDVIIGPIANDTLYETFGVLSSGFVSRETALKVLKYGNEYTQIVIKSSRANAQLKWINSVTLTDDELEGFSSYMKEENEKFQMYLAKELNYDE